MLEAEGYGHGVVLLPSVHGVNRYVKMVEERLEAASFGVQTVNYYGDTEEPRLTSAAEMIAALRGCRQVDVLARVDEARERLGRSGSRVFSLLGFCIGGTFAYHAACARPGRYQALGMFYPNLRIPDQWQVPIESPLEAGMPNEVPFLAHFGDSDEYVPLKDIEAFRQQTEDVGMIKLYPGSGHAFHDHSREDRYDPTAADQAWSSTLEFFRHRAQLASRTDA